MNRKTILLWAILLTGISFLPFFIDSRNTYFLSISYMFFMTGFGMVFDFMNLSVAGKSFLSQRYLPVKLAGLFILSMAVTVIMELSGNIVGNFWFYPYYSFGQYLSLIFFNFFTYTFLMLEGYWAFRALISPSVKDVDVKKNSQMLTALAGYLKHSWIPAVIFLIAAAIFQKFPGTTGEMINTAFLNQVPIVVFLLFAVSVWLFFEAASFRRGGETILFDLLKGDYRNIIYAFLASLVTSVAFEYYNLFFGFWVYDNVPFSQYQFLNIPVAVFAAWPLQYLALIPMHSLLMKRIKSR